MHVLYKSIVVLSLLQLFSFSSWSQNYVPDKYFGSCGISLLDFGDEQPELKATIILPNRKMLTAGNRVQTVGNASFISLNQYLPNGSLDTIGFGIDGSVFVQFNFTSNLQTIVRQATGEIVAVGYENNTTQSSNNTPSVSRFTSSGKIDSSFNGNGVNALRFDNLSSGVLSQVIMYGTDIIAAGLSTSNTNGGIDGLGVMKFKSTGVVDNSFGNITGYPGRSRIAMTGVSSINLFQQNDTLIIPFVRADSIRIARIKPDGTVDNNFGSAGVINTGIRSENLLAVRQPDNKYLFGGTLNQPLSPKRIQFLRYNTNLTPDNGFGTNGVIILPTFGNTNSDNVLRSISLLPGGKILLLAHIINTGSSLRQPLLIRLLPNGMLDSSFNNTGSMPVNSEFNNGLNEVDAIEDTAFLISRATDFKLLKYVPDTTRFNNVATADFKHTTEKLNVTFQNLSTNATVTNWDFGDGQSSDQVNPTHEYAQPGLYTVSLESTASCGSDMMIKAIDVLGIYKIDPTEGPDNGFVRLRIHEFGFSSIPTVQLKNVSGITITADTVFADTATQTLQANFLFVNAPVGRYDVILATPGRIDTLEQGFDIKTKDIGARWVQISGPLNSQAVSLGRYATFRLDYGVTGNATHYLVPIALVIRGKDLLPEMITNMANTATSNTLPDSLRPHSNGFYHYYDEIRKDSVWIFYIADPVVTPGRSHFIYFSIIAKTLNKFTISAYIGNSLFDKKQTDTLYNNLRTQGLCDNQCIKCMLDVAGYVPGPVGCAAGILSLACSVNDFEITPETSVGEVVSLGLDFAATTIGCGSGTSGSFGKLMEQVEESVFGFLLKQKGNAGTVSDCGAAIGSLSGTNPCNPKEPADDDEVTIDPVSSFDPNDKIGPGVNNRLHYISKKENLSYTTYFENLSSATAPALEVEIIDTLNKAVMDMTSFRFTQFNISGTNYSIFNDRDSFVTDVEINNKPILVRVEGKIDTLKGIVRWKFTSLDTTSMSFVADTSHGFLPPNADGVSGTGSVSYFIKQKSSNIHLTNISNRAKIVFDVNPPIFTDAWINIVDTIKPESHVLNTFRILSDSTFSIKWSGTDAHAGIRDYKIAVSVNDSPYVILGAYGIDSTVMKGKHGSMYKFISIATDSAGNVEDIPNTPLTNPDAVFTFNQPMPIELLSFAAAKENRHSLLKWSTTSETNTSHFNVEYSSDGARFTALPAVAAAGTSGTRNDYSFVHRQTVKGNNYYRLKIVDKDNSFKYSPVKMLRFDEVTEMVLIPNPAKGRVTIQVSETGGTISLVNSAGRIVNQRVMLNGAVTINLKTFVAGLYIVTYVTKNNEVVQHKLIVNN